MRRSEFEHVIRASGEIAGDDVIIVIGTQAVLGQFPDAPVALLVSMEADVYPRNKPEKTDSIDGAIGEGSSFHELHGYYAQGVGERTAVLPNGWQDRLVPVINENTDGVTGLCLEVHDLAVSKLIAQRPKDLQFVQELARRNMIQKRNMLRLLEETDIDNRLRSSSRKRIRQLYKA